MNTTTYVYQEIHLNMNMSLYHTLIIVVFIECRRRSEFIETNNRLEAELAPLRMRSVTHNCILTIFDSIRIKVLNIQK